MNRLNVITKQIENAMLKSRGLDDKDFIELINNIEIIKINTTQLRKRLNIKDFDLYETNNSNNSIFRQFLNNGI